MPANDDVRPFLPLTRSSYQLLLALVPSALHGYGIRRDVEARTEGTVRLGSATLYGALRQLRADGLIEEAEGMRDPRLDDERRRYYRLTPLGRRVLDAQTDYDEEQLRRARAVLSRPAG